MYYRSSILIFVPLALGAVFQEKSVHYSGTYSEDFVNRWGFQKLCDLVYDPHTNAYAWPTKQKGVTFNPKKVQAGDVIFVRQVHRFMRKIHPKITYPYIMVTAGEMRDQVTHEHLAYLDDDKIIAWFAVHQDCNETHAKLHQLPLGIFQDKQYYKKRGSLTHTFAQWRAAPKNELLYSNFGDLRGAKPERAEVDEYFSDKPYCTTIKQRMPFLSYMEQMSAYKFSLSPRGYGPDTYRTWEALLVGSIPIVRTSPLDNLYADLPVLIVEDWTSITEEFLNKKYKEMTAQKWPIEKLFIGYWATKIQQIRDTFLQRWEVSHETT